MTFVATARAGDAELDARIAAHRRDRPGAWRTIEADTDLDSSVATVGPEDVLLLDSLTLWVAWALHSAGPDRALAPDPPTAMLHVPASHPGPAE